MLRHAIGPVKLQVAAPGQTSEQPLVSSAMEGAFDPHDVAIGITGHAAPPAAAITEVVWSSSAFGLSAENNPRPAGKRTAKDGTRSKAEINRGAARGDEKPAANRPSWLTRAFSWCPDMIGTQWFSVLGDAPSPEVAELQAQVSQLRQQMLAANAMQTDMAVLHAKRLDTLQAQVHECKAGLQACRNQLQMLESRLSDPVRITQGIDDSGSPRKPSAFARQKRLSLWQAISAKRGR